MRRTASLLGWRFLVASVVCLGIGALGGVVTARTLDESGPRPPQRFVPPQTRAADFRLRDQDGHWTSLRDARRHVVVLTFLYSTCRDLCPAQAAKIKDAVLAVGKGVEVLGVSVDPVGDTPARARSFLKRYGLYGGPVRFLVGSRRQLRPVWAAYGIVPIGATPAEAAAAAQQYQREQDEYRDERKRRRILARRPAPPGADARYPDVNRLRFSGRARHVEGSDFEHSAYVLLIDKHGRQRVGFPFEELRPSLLIRDMRTLLAEA
jgi:protein SCO1/2